MTDTNTTPQTPATPPATVTINKPPLNPPQPPKTEATDSSMQHASDSEDKYLLPNWAYQILKWCCLLLLPALAVLVNVLGGTWGWPYTQQIVTTINAVAVFVAAVIGVSQVAKN